MLESIMEIARNTDWAAVAGIAAAFVLAFDRLAKITPTETDNKIVGWAYKVFKLLGVKIKDNPGSKSQ